MLKELHIKNVAVIEEVRIEFNNGFNVLTGETGAGKSILIDSINMALGARSRRDLIRSGAEFALVDLGSHRLCGGLLAAPWQEAADPPAALLPDRDVPCLHSLGNPNQPCANRPRSVVGVHSLHDRRNRFLYSF